MSLSPENIALCQHIKANDTRCASPALRGRKFCYFHKQERQKQLEANANMRRERLTIRLPIPQDAESIKMARIKVMQLSVMQKIDHPTEALMHHALQIASNLPQTSSPGKKRLHENRPQRRRR